LTAAELYFTLELRPAAIFLGRLFCGGG